MGGFQTTELEAGEEILFGPVTSTKTTSLSGGAGPSQSSISRMSGQTVGITDRRIIIEDLDTPANSRTIPNGEVQKVFVNRKQQAGHETLTIARIQTTSGQTIKINLPGVSAARESLLQQTFPNAEISAKSSSRGIMIGAAVVGGLIVLCCLISFVGPLVLSWFTN